MKPSVLSFTFFLTRGAARELFCFSPDFHLPSMLCVRPPSFSFFENRGAFVLHSEVPVTFSLDRTFLSSPIVYHSRKVFFNSQISKNSQLFFVQKVEIVDFDYKTIYKRENF